MATLAKHPKSRFFTAVWRDQTGRQIRRSTKATDRKSALRIAREYEEATLKRRSAQQVRAVIASLHRELTGDELVFPTARAYVNDWLSHKGVETAESTLAFYKKSTTKFLAHLGETADKTIDQIAPQHITGFRNAQARALGAKTVNHDLKCVRMIFRQAKKDGFVYENPAEDVDTIRGKGREGGRRAFMMPELRAIMDAADEEWKSMIQFGLYTGMRLADVAFLTWANLDTARGELRYVMRKTGKTIMLPIVGPLALHIASLEAPDSLDVPLHPRAHDVMTRTGKSGTLSNWFANVLADAGLRKRQKHHRTKKDVIKGRHAKREKSELSFHSLRHTAVSLLKNAGVPVSVVMALTGHDSEQMSEHYTHVGREALAKAAKKMPRLVTI